MPKVISKDGTSIAFERTGQGPVVIVVDGAMCSRVFGPSRQLAPLLAGQFTVIIYDRRGRNESGDSTPYSVQREIEDIDALITEAGGAASLVGFSSGAALAFRAAASGIAVKKLLLYEPPYVKDMGGHTPPPDTERQFNKFTAAGHRSEAVQFFIRDVVGLPVIFAFISRLMPAWSKLKAVAHTLSYDAAIMGDYSLPVKMAASVTTPTLLVAGEKTAKSLRNAAEHMAKAIPNARCRLLKGQSHNVSVKAIAPIIIDYFSH